jgi:hypothetical protein
MSKKQDLLNVFSFIADFLKEEIKEEIKNEVLTPTKTETNPIATVFDNMMSNVSTPRYVVPKDLFSNKEKLLVEDGAAEHIKALMDRMERSDKERAHLSEIIKKEFELKNKLKETLSTANESFKESLLEQKNLDEADDEVIERAPIETYCDSPTTTAETKKKTTKKK